MTLFTIGGNGKKDKIVSLLAEYAEAVDALNAYLESVPELKERQDKVAGIKAQVTEQVKKVGGTVKGEQYQAVYMPEGVTVKWDDGQLIGYALNHPEILVARTEKKKAARVSVRKVK